ncbi:hypothetical protein [Legionella birminghamensis]|uniref:Uncharacterized protein n=1 Tax=Legionella birminghamensis TaxID=28083 RepID=A0A378IDV4_9GAMM|nr:hypothetical protein [Legionella birminghamensis]STX32922.1 Uncharacterised protein [Legionella birminghamensis]
MIVPNFHKLIRYSRMIIKAFKEINSKKIASQGIKNLTADFIAYATILPT